MALEPLKSQLRILASEHHRAGRWDDAAACYGEVLALDPGDAACHYLLAFVEAARGSPDCARDCVLAALAIEPSNPDFLFLLGELERQRGDLAASIRAFEGALQRTQPVPERLVQLSDLYLAVGRPGAAEARAREAVGMSGADPEALHMLADTIRAQGRADESLDIYRAAAAGDAIYTVRHQNLLMTMNYAGALAPDEVFRAHRDAGRMPNLNPAATKLASHWSSPPASTGPTRLRVGYVSADFGHHVVSFFFEPVAAAHHRDRVEVFCYFTGGVEDEQCARLRSTGVVWRNVANLAVDDLVALMRADELHVAVDLSGHTAGNRLEVFARRVAPAQVSWLGYPNTSGVPAIDFRLTDATCDPVGMTATLHTETLWRLPRCFLVYRPRDDAPALTGPPGEVNGFVTFGCFNRIEKLSTEALRIWARVLAAVPGSRLLLKARNLGEPDLASAIRARFDAAMKRHGVKLAAAEKKVLFRGVSWPDENAPPVIAKRTKLKARDSYEPDLYGAYLEQVGKDRYAVEYESDSVLRDTEQVPLKEPGGIEAFFRREVLPHAPDAWIARDATKIGYEVSFARYFYRPAPLRTLDEIRAEILALEQQTEGLLQKVIGTT